MKYPGQTNSMSEIGSPKQFKAVHNSLKLVFGITWKIDDYTSLWDFLDCSFLLNVYWAFTMLISRRIDD